MAWDVTAVLSWPLWRHGRGDVTGDPTWLWYHTGVITFFKAGLHDWLMFQVNFRNFKLRNTIVIILLILKQNIFNVEKRFALKMLPLVDHVALVDSYTASDWVLPYFLIINRDCESIGTLLRFECCNILTRWVRYDPPAGRDRFLSAAKRPTGGSL